MGAPPVKLGFAEAEGHLLAVAAGRETPEGAVAGGLEAARAELARLYERWGER